MEEDKGMLVEEREDAEGAGDAGVAVDEDSVENLVGKSGEGEINIVVKDGVGALLEGGDGAPSSVAWTDGDAEGT